MKFTRNAANIFLIVVFILLIPINIARAANPISSFIWDHTVGDILRDEQNLRGMAVGILAVGVADAAQVAITGCPTDGLIENSITKSRANNIPIDSDYQSTGEECKLDFMGIQGAYGNGSLLAIATISAGDALDSPPPANLAYFFNDMKNDSLVFNSAYAAEDDSVLTGLLVIWKYVRNMSYGLLAVFLIATAMMIALRSKLDAQNVVTAQAALPRIIISAILITFSYALGALILQLSGPSGPLAGIVYFIIGDAFINIVQSAWNECALIIPSVPLNNPILATLAGVVSCVVFRGAVILQGSLGVGMNLAYAAALIMTVIAIVAMVFTYFKLYIKIILLTIFSPFFFAIAAIPGQEKRIKDWFLDMISAAVAIPALIFVAMFSALLFFNLILSSDVNNGFSYFVNTNIMRFWLGLLIFIIGMFSSLKVPGEVDKAIKGGGGKKK